jgi:hypothetical protein
LPIGEEEETEIIFLIETKIQGNRSSFVRIKLRFERMFVWIV